MNVEMEPVASFLDWDARVEAIALPGSEFSALVLGQEGIGEATAVLAHAELGRLAELCREAALRLPTLPPQTASQVGTAAAGPTIVIVASVRGRESGQLALGLAVTTPPIRVKVIDVAGFQAVLSLLLERTRAVESVVEGTVLRVDAHGRSLMLDVAGTTLAFDCLEGLFHGCWDDGTPLALADLSPGVPVRVRGLKPSRGFWAALRLEARRCPRS